MSVILIQKADLAAASFNNNNTNAAGGITVRVDAGSTVGAAIQAAVNSAVTSLPTDIYVNGLTSYNTTTNVLTLSLSDGSTQAIPMSTLVADAVAESLVGINVQLLANDGTTVLGYIKP